MDLFVAYLLNLEWIMDYGLWIIICVSRPKSASFSSESGFSTRGAAVT
jgi:hypothetical protein